MLSTRAPRALRTVLGLLAAFASILASIPATAHAQHSLEAEDGDVQHQILFAGLVGVYFRGPPGRTPTVGCVVLADYDAHPHLAVTLDLGLSGGPCEAAALPRLDSTAMHGFVVADGTTFRPLATTVGSSLRIPFGDAETAWRVATTVATAHDDCTPEPESSGWRRLACQSGLAISTSGPPHVVSIRFETGGVSYGGCDAFVDETGFEGAVLSLTEDVCTRTGRIRSTSTRADVEAALGTTCSEPDATHLRCGEYVLTRGYDPSLWSMIERTRH